jgi:hypothetical protein
MAASSEAIAVVRRWITRAGAGELAEVWTDMTVDARLQLALLRVSDQVSAMARFGRVTPHRQRSLIMTAHEIATEGPAHRHFGSVADHAAELFRKVDGTGDWTSCTSEDLGDIVVVTYRQLPAAGVLEFTCAERGGRCRFAGVGRRRIDETMRSMRARRTELLAAGWRVGA